MGATMKKILSWIFWTAFALAMAYAAYLLIRLYLRHFAVITFWTFAVVGIGFALVHVLLGVVAFWAGWPLMDRESAPWFLVMRRSVARQKVQMIRLAVSTVALLLVIAWCGQLSQSISVTSR